MKRLSTLFGSIKHRLLQLRLCSKEATHRSFHLTPKFRPKVRLGGVTEAWLLMVETALFIRRHARLFVSMALLYALLTYVLVGGISQLDYTAFKESSANLAHGLDIVTTAGAYLGAILTGGFTELSTTLRQLIAGLIALIFWLATVWAVRMLTADKVVKLRDAFYSGTTPLVSTLVLLVIILVQLAPAALGLFSMAILIGQGWITTALSGLAYGVVAALLCLLSLYWVTGSVVALAVVALPGMYPLHAVVNARELVAGKRWDIALRIVSMALVLLLVWGAILLPVLILDSWLAISWLPLVPVMVQALSGVSIIFTSIYVYKLYRSLL